MELTEEDRDQSQFEAAQEKLGVAQEEVSGALYPCGFDHKSNYEMDFTIAIESYEAP